MEHGHGAHLRPKLELADIVRAYGAQFRAKYRLNADQLHALSNIENCRTAALGGFVFRCQDCGHEQPQYRSCGNRHCPKCQVIEQEKWIKERLERVLPVPHCHVVFTLPAQLRSLCQYQSEALFRLLFRTCADVLLEFASRHLQAEPAITTVLHTWTRQLTYHPHVHCIVTAGGLSLDGQSWKPSKAKFLFPVKAMSKVFRGKFLDGLRRLYNNQELEDFELFDDPQGFDRLIATLAKIPWAVYCKKPFRCADHVFQYLGRYTHRVGIANSRLVCLTDGQVTFRTKNGKTTTLEPVEFLHRFVQHVLPKGFVKIRHYGLLSPSHVGSRLSKAKAILPLSKPAEPQQSDIDQDSEWQAQLFDLSKDNLFRCPRCGSNNWSPIPTPSARDPPAVAPVA
jgi:hypothetical protein